MVKVMPWRVRAHRCALPAIPDNIGPGSVWQCGDVGTYPCGIFWRVTDAFGWEQCAPPVETAVVPPGSNVERRNQFPVPLVLG